jgi:hypothetical protein
MKKAKCTVLFSALLILLAGCGGDNSSSFPMGKKYWTPEDYHDVNSELTNLKFNEKELPNLDNPKTATVFKKIADTIHFAIVANDDQLGIKHRSEFMSDMFNQYRELVSSYSIIDRKDKYQYPVEFIQILKFGLALQVYYIKTGNENIIKDADDPQAANILNLLKGNREILIRNYDLYLDFINYEDRFTEVALISYGDGIRDFFPRLINDVVPDGDYTSMLNKVDNMIKKSKNQLIITQLQNIQGLIKSKTQNKSD